jgi:hypothetical protein
MRSTFHLSVGGRHGNNVVGPGERTIASASEADAASGLTAAETRLLGDIGARRPAHSHVPLVAPLLAGVAAVSLAAALVHDHRTGFAFQEIAWRSGKKSSAATTYVTRHHDALLTAGVVLGAAGAVVLGLVAYGWAARVRVRRRPVGRAPRWRSLPWALAGLACAGTAFATYSRFDVAPPGVEVTAKPDAGWARIDVSYLCKEPCTLDAAALHTGCHGDVSASAVFADRDAKAAVKTKGDGRAVITVPEEKSGRLGRAVILALRFVDPAHRASTVEVDLKTPAPPRSAMSSTAQGRPGDSDDC